MRKGQSLSVPRRGFSSSLQFSASLQSINFFSPQPMIAIACCCCFFFSRSFSQKRAAVEKDYALVRQSLRLLVCHGAALMFVKTSLLKSVRPSVLCHFFRLPGRSRKEKEKRKKSPSSATVGEMSSADVSSLFSLCRRIAASETEPSERPPRCLAGAVQVLQPGEESPATLRRVRGSSAVGRRPALHDDTQRRAHTCCDSPRRRRSTGLKILLSPVWT